MAAGMETVKAEGRGKCRREGGVAEDSGLVELRAEPAACRGGFYLDDTASVKPCPDGAFCMAGQTCFVLCARGAMCR